MTVRVAINGFGRIGRLILRAILENNYTNLQVVAVNDLAPMESQVYLMEYDSVHGHFPFQLSVREHSLQVKNHTISLLSEAKSENLPWKDLNIDVVLECSGRLTSHAKASQHLMAGAKKVLISAPADDADITVVYGVNHTSLKAHHRIVSNASCTTNCLAPLVSVLHETVGFVQGYMTTIHAYTGDQRLVDTHHEDLRRARAAPLSMIPSTTGAARAVGLVLPALKGKIDGTAIRVPVPNVSLVDLTFVTPQPTTCEVLHEKLEEAANSTLKGILEVNKLPLVSSDFNHRAASSIVDFTQTQVVDKTFCRLLAWYDNEWGFSNRMVDVASLLGVL